MCDHTQQEAGVSMVLKYELQNRQNFPYLVCYMRVLNKPLAFFEAKKANMNSRRFPAV